MLSVLCVEENFDVAALVPFSQSGAAAAAIMFYILQTVHQVGNEAEAKSKTPGYQSPDAKTPQLARREQQGLWRGLPLELTV